MTWAEAKEWAVWSFGGIGAFVGFRRFASDRKTARNAAIDARIIAVVNPELLHDKLNRLAEGQDAMNEKIDRVKTAVDRLEGANAARYGT